MSSKLNEHAELVATQLQKGLSYSQIVIVLSESGCVTSRQNLISWLNRRAKRIRSRLHLIDPSAALRASNQQISTSTVHEPLEKETVLDDAVSARPEQEIGFVSDVFRRGSVVKPPLSSVQQQMKELARQASLPAPLVWKYKKKD